MTHDPMLDGIPAYTMDVLCMSYCYGGSPRLEADEWPDDNCVVKWSDLPALIARVREDEREACARAIAALENVGGYPQYDFDHIRDDVIDAIRARREKS